MTNEETIKTLKENCCAMCAYGSQDMDSCDIRGCDNRDAIKALEQEPCEDCISRQAVIDALSHMCSEDEHGITVSRANVNSMLRVLPPVTPQPKTAHWIHFANSDDCSGCGWSTGKYISPSDYCPKCGARMIEPTESEEVDSDEPAD